MSAWMAWGGRAGANMRAGAGGCGQVRAMGSPQFGLGLFNLVAVEAIFLAVSDIKSTINVYLQAFAANVFIVVAEKNGNLILQWRTHDG